MVVPTLKCLSLAARSYAFRSSTKIESEHKFVLRGLDPAARYQLRFHDHSSPDLVLDGGTLRKTGLTVCLPESNSSEIIFLEELPSQSPSSPIGAKPTSPSAQNLATSE
jgi:hypothetical protein